MEREAALRRLVVLRTTLLGFAKCAESYQRLLPAGAGIAGCPRDWRGRSAQRRREGRADRVPGRLGHVDGKFVALRGFE